jgi:protein-L-isoaspartate(D-aspartate) O-methyltransferase
MSVWNEVRKRLEAFRQGLPSLSEFSLGREWPEITDPRVRAAFEIVPRAAFVPEHLRKWSLRDAPLPIGEGQTISQPFVVALMVQALKLEPGDKVLEVGTGSGFQTAILCELTAEPDMRPGANVFSVEQSDHLAKRAQTTLNQFGYVPHLRVGDGAAGWPEAAPFDAIVVSAAPWSLPRPLWEQLADGGRLLIPIGDPHDEQMLWCLRKEQNAMHAESMGPVRFVPLLTTLLDDPAMRKEIR